MPWPVSTQATEKSRCNLGQCAVLYFRFKRSGGFSLLFEANNFQTYQKAVANNSMPWTVSTQEAVSKAAYMSG